MAHGNELVGARKQQQQCGQKKEEEEEGLKMKQRTLRWQKKEKDDEQKWESETESVNENAGGCWSREETTHSHLSMMSANQSEGEQETGRVDLHVRKWCESVSENAYQRGAEAFVEKYENE